MTKHILVCDERGTTGFSSKSNTFTIGGFAAIESVRPYLVSTWDRIKTKLCGTKNVELKWSHFFPGPHQQAYNPLLSSNPTQWREQALWALNEIFDDVHIFPITTIVRKDKVKGSDLIVTRSGKDYLDEHRIFAVTIGQFATYLKDHKGKHGEIWFDKKGSAKEEQRWQANLTTLHRTLPQSPMSPENKAFVLRVNSQIKFYDSKAEPLVQVADYVSGLIWAASEGDEYFLKSIINKYGLGKRRTYGIFIVEA